VKTKSHKQEQFQPSKMSLSELTPYLFIFPVLLLLVMLVVYPLSYGVYISFFDTDLGKNWSFAGFRNYLVIFTQDNFLKNIWVTFKFAFLVVAGHFVIGILLGLALNQKKRGTTVFRTILVLPWLFPDVVIALIFKWLANPMYGLFNSFLLEHGLIEKQISWLGSTQWAFAVVVLVCIWKGYPMVLVNVLAALQSVSSDILEAARVDGANAVQLLFRIILPAIKPVLATTVILDVVWWFKHYTIVELLTSGGPNSVTSIVSIGIYKEAFQYFKFGRAAAMAVVVFVICYLISKVFRKVLSDDE
jgi:multiple sugar transport system permease protein